MKRVIFIALAILSIFPSCRIVESDIVEIYVNGKGKDEASIFINLVGKSYVYKGIDRSTQRDYCEVGGCRMTTDSLVLLPKYKVFRDSLDSTKWNADVEEKNGFSEARFFEKCRNRIEGDVVLYKVKVRKTKSEEGLIYTRNHISKFGIH